jgi:hypothetical protein
VRTRDRRSFRVALVADRFLNPPPRGMDVIPILLEAGWGVIQLPADDYPSQVSRPLLEQVAEQAEEFHRHGYDVVVIGRRAGLDAALAKSGLPPFDRVDPASARALHAFLRKRSQPKVASRGRTARSRTKWSTP